MDRAKRLSLYIFYGLLAYVPLHIFLSTWLGTSLGLLTVAKVAKDVAMVLGFGLALTASGRQPWFKRLVKDRLVWIILAYALLTVLLALGRPTDQDAETLGIVYNTRFLLFFLYALLLSQLFHARHLIIRSVQIVLGVAMVVGFFGVVQYTLLPNDTLTHVGYSRANGVLPAFFIDDKPDLERVMSTLRDPNSLGSYLVIVGAMTLALFMGVTAKHLKRPAAALFCLNLLCLWFTFSRSAWLGMAAAIGTILFLGAKRGLSNTAIRRLLVAGVVGGVLVGVGAAVFRNSYFVRNVIFHADEATVLEDPNQLRARFVEESIRKAMDNPLGHGPGTAGLASIHNEKQGVILNENYYLQLLHEVGLLGLALFISILIIVGRRLLVLKDSALVVGLFAALIGLMVTNLFVHIWSNEAVAYTWWGLTGLVLGDRLILRAGQKDRIL